MKRALASILVSSGSAKYVFIDSRVDAMTSSGIPWFVTAYSYQQVFMGAGEYRTVEKADVDARVPYLLCKSLLNVGVRIADVLQVSGNRDG
jgi:hypothetical protein